MMTRQTCSVAGLLATALALALVLLLVHSGWISTFAVVAEAGGDEPAQPFAVAISRLLFGGLAVVLLALFGYVYRRLT